MKEILNRVKDVITVIRENYFKGYLALSVILLLLSFGILGIPIFTLVVGKGNIETVFDKLVIFMTLNLLFHFIYYFAYYGYYITIRIPLKANNYNSKFMIRIGIYFIRFAELFSVIAILSATFTSISTNIIYEDMLMIYFWCGIFFAMLKLDKNYVRLTTNSNKKA